MPEAVSARMMDVMSIAVFIMFGVGEDRILADFSKSCVLLTARVRYNALIVFLLRMCR